MSRHKTVVIAVPESDCHVVALNLLAWYLTQLAYHVIDLGVTTPSSEIVHAVSTYNPIAVCISAQNGHAEIDLADLAPQLRSAGIEIPIFIGGRLGLPSREGDALIAARFARQGMTVLSTFDCLAQRLHTLSQPLAGEDTDAPRQRAVSY
jgi:methylaspartate mutase sigma subunit